MDVFFQKSMKINRQMLRMQTSHRNLVANFITHAVNPGDRKRYSSCFLMLDVFTVPAVVDME